MCHLRMIIEPANCLVGGYYRSQTFTVWSIQTPLFLFLVMKLFIFCTNVDVTLFLSHEICYVSLDTPNEPIDVIDAASSGGAFLGFGRISEGTVTVFAPKHGIMAIKPGTADGL